MKKKFKIGYGKAVKMEFLFSVVAKEKSVHGKVDSFSFAIQCFYQYVHHYDISFSKDVWGLREKPQNTDSFREGAVLTLKVFYFHSLNNF